MSRTRPSLIQFALGMLINTSLLVAASAAQAEGSTILPTLIISDRGELLMDGEDFSYAEWRSDKPHSTIHVIQYFGGTVADSKVFKPFTDLLQSALEPGTVHVTSIINLNAATWGTAGFVVSELKKNKKKHPEATMVLDEEGAGVAQWGLGEDGTGLFIVDTDGTVLFFTGDTLSEEEMQANLEMIKTAAPN